MSKPETALLPCAHCGGAARLIVHKMNWHFAFCQRHMCGVSTPHYETREQALNAWNNRAEPAPNIAGTSIETLKRRINARLNDHLAEMKPDYDDSVVGFNEAWDAVRAAFAEALQHG